VSTLKPGDKFYYFEIVRVLGEGFHGQVYLIRHRETGDLFALKTMHAADCVDPNKTARALVGAKGNYRIDHRNVVHVLDLNCESNGLVWMRTEFLQGLTIQEILARQGRLSLPFALATAIEAAFGLHAVHEAQIIHRDVKPSNLFYTEGRAVKVIDLSLAKVFPEGLETTVGGRLGLGTPAYSAPEQLEGHVRPDVRFDVYGLGITLWEMLTGKNPFNDVLNDTQELLRRQLTVMPPLLADVANLPPQVDVVVRRAIAKNPAARYASMMEMARALMGLNTWIAAEARARRLAIAVPPGEPPLPGDTNTWRDYRALEALPVHDPPGSVPSARVVLREATPLAATLDDDAPTLHDDGRGGLPGTMPMNPRGGLAATLPLDQASVGTGILKTVRGTALGPPEPARPLVVMPVRGPESVRGPEPVRAEEARPSDPATRSSPTPAWQPAAASSPASTPTLAALAHTQSSVTERSPARPLRRARWSAVVLAIMVASLASVALVVWFLGRSPARVSAGPAQIQSAAPPAEPTERPPPPRVTSTASAISSAPTVAAASASSPPATSAASPPQASASRRPVAPAKPIADPFGTWVAPAQPAPPPAPTHRTIFGIEN
jgi:eukaryotic-like serine/threonine-protein kinase